MGREGAYMVRTSSIVFISVSLLLSLVLPLVVAIVLHKRLRFAWKSVLVGALVFLVFQILTRLPLLQYMQSALSFQAFSMRYPILEGFLIALSAALFEEMGRYAGFRLLLQKHLDWKGGIAYGIGHGGLESLLVSTAFLNDLIYSFLINAGKAPPQLPQSIISSLVNTAPPQFVIGGIERVLAFVVQIGFSLIVLYGIKSKKGSFLLLAIALHTILDFGAVVFAGNTLVGEIYVALFAVASIVWILKSKRLFIEKEPLDSEQNPTADCPESPIP
jgi:uncharacterized membrane protein YhfC